MTRRYDEPVEVRRRDEDPAEFLWRGRLYVVRAVLAHWVETRAWWKAATSGFSALASDPSVLDPSVLGAEREVWRVEASAGRADGTGVYDVCFDWSAGGHTPGAQPHPWILLRTMD